MKHRQLQARRLNHQPFTRLIPNALTLLNMCAGVTALRFALNDQFEAAVAAILLAGVLDLLDGGMARWLGASSKLGAELDSLADLVSFGVAPGVIVYAWTMHTVGIVGWLPTLLFSVCATLRLARFNVAQAGTADPPGAYCYFIGLPTPAAAGIILLPMLLGFQYPDGPFNDVLLNGSFIVAAAALMVSRIPTFSLKGGLVPHKYLVPALLLFCLVVGFAVDAPWATLTVVMFCYISSIPFSLISFRRLQRKSLATPEPAQFNDGA